MKFIFASVIEFLIILNAVIKVNCQICSTNWKLFGETYYLEVSTAKTFQDAKENCQLIGAELAMPKTTAQNVFLKSLACRPPLGLHRYWIGMTDLSKENAFKWEDGTFLDWGNERWAPGEPNNRWEQDCVAFIIAQDGDTNGKWSTERCSSNLLSLCSKRLVLPKLSQSPTVQNIRTTSFQLRWRCWTNVEDQGDGPVLGYNIDLTVAQYPTDADWRTVGFVLGGDHCEFSVEHLQIKTKYYVAVSILHGDSRHEGPRGPMLRVNTHDVELPVLLDPPEVIDVGRFFVMITWTRWTGKVGEGYGPIAGYNFNIKNGAIWKTLVTLAAVAVDLEFNVTGLEPDTPFQFMVTVIYQDGRAGPPGQILSVFTEPNELPVLLDPPEVIDVGRFFVMITWTRWTGKVGEGYGPIAGYNVNIKNGAIWKMLVTLAAVAVDLEFNVTGLEPDTPYQFMVIVIYQDGRAGPPGQILSVFTEPNELPVLLDPPEVIDVGRSFVMITWTRWTGKVGEGYGPIAGYNVNIKNGAIWKTLVTLAAVAVDLEFNVTGLEPDTPYQFMVTVIYQDGRAGPPGQILCVFTEPNELCTEPDTASFSSGDNTTQWVLTTKNPDCIHPRTHQCTTWKILFCLLVLLCVGVGAMISIQRCRRSKTSSASRQDPEDREDHHEQCENRHTYPHVSTSSNSRYIDNDFQTSRTTLNYSSGYVRSLNRGGCIKQDM